MSKLNNYLGFNFPNVSDNNQSLSIINNMNMKTIVNNDSPVYDTPKTKKPSSFFDILHKSYYENKNLTSKKMISLKCSENELEINNNLIESPDNRNYNNLNKSHNE